MSSNIQSKYDKTSIKKLKGLDPVRMRPGMYIGSTDYMGTHHLVWEVVDNAVDEAMVGYGNKIYVTLHDDGSCSVRDEGRGIPCGYNEEEKMEALDLVFRELHAGGKFDDSNYKESAGLHGVGAACTNALSEYVEIKIYRDGREYYCKYSDGGRKSTGVKEVGPTTKRGTYIRFKPSTEVLTDVTFRYELIAEHLNNSACQVPGVHFYLSDERTKTKEEFFYQNGISEYLAKINEGKEQITPVITFKDDSQEIKVEIAFQFLENDYSEHLYSFANTVFTPNEGSHVRGYRSGLTKAFNDYASANGIIKGENKLDGGDIREGLSIVVSVKVPEKLIQFEGQTKGKLGTPSAAFAVENVMCDKMRSFLDENKTYATKIMAKILNAQKTRLAARTVRDEMRGKGTKNNEKTTLLLSGKLVPPQSKDYRHCELFIVEGDSAGGSAKKCRDRRYQGLLPLRGKPKNISNEAEDAFMKNEELSTLAYTIGTGVDKNFNIKDLHYDKIIIMTDADTDGAHIQNLLINFFFLKMLPLIETGHIYIACPPLYRVSKMVGKKTIEEFVWTDDELAAAKKKIGANAVVSRYKGLGEMDADQLWRTTMDPKTRKLIRVSIPDFESARSKVNLFMGKDAAPRSRWINENVDFSNKDDNFKLEVNIDEQ